MINIKNKIYYNEYIRISDGIYNSFWIGKMINKFVKNGKKSIIENRFEKIYTYIKVSLCINFNVFVLERLERIRPIFKLKSKLVAGKSKEYPVLLNQDKSRLYGVNNIYNSISRRKEWYIDQRILNDFLDLSNNSNHHDLVLNQKTEFESSIENRFNIRFGKPRIKKR
jgi:ribosomal protein S7